MADKIVVYVNDKPISEPLEDVEEANAFYRRHLAKQRFPAPDKVSFHKKDKKNTLVFVVR